MKTTRLRAGGIQVSRVTLRKLSGHEITIQGTIHVGSQVFYQKVLSLMRKFDGEVHLEGIKSSEGYDVPMQMLGLVYSGIQSLLGLEKQTDYINRSLLHDSNKYKNHDLAFSQVMDFFGRDLIEGITAFSTLDFDGIALKVGSSPLPLFFLAKTITEDMSGKEIVLDKRNEFAIAEAVQSPENVFLFWGAAHIKGMVALLEEQEYRIVHTQWETVIPLFRTMGKEVLARRARDLESSQHKIKTLLKTPEWEALSRRANNLELT